MSDLTATNCGCSNSSNWSNNGCCGNNFIWIILLLFCCNGNGSGLLGGNSCGCDDNCNNNSCDWLIWILLISCFCGNKNGCC